MSGRAGNAQAACDLDDGGGRGFGGKSVDWPQFHDLETHRADDAPSTHSGAESHCRGSREDDPERDRPFVATPAVIAGERESEHAHRLLGVIAPVAEGHERGGKNLEAAEDTI